MVNRLERRGHAAVIVFAAGLMFIAAVLLIMPSKAHAETKTVTGNYALLESGTLTFKYAPTETLAHGDAVYTGFDTAIYEISPEGTTVPWNSLRGYINKAVFDSSVKGNLKPISTQFWFSGLTNLKEVEGLKNLDTSHVTLMGDMFYGCSSLKNLDVSGFDTSRVTKMYRMFGSCSSLTSLDVSGFDTSQVTTASAMFCGCSSLTSLDVTNFDVSKVVSMGYMFADCTSLKTIYATSSWLEKNSSMSSAKMFDSCTSLVGSNGTKYNSAHVDAEYARLDAAGKPGYFSVERTSISGASVTLSQSTYTYDGEAKEPGVTVKFNGKTLAAGTDYTVSYSDNVNVGTATALVTGVGSYAGSTSKSFSINAAPSPTPDPAPAIKRVNMHRLYNPNSGEHFYTASDSERDGLVAEGWSSEGEGWAAPETSNTPVFRMYNPVAGEHHYTPNTEERDNLIAAGWNDEGTGWYSDDSETVPLYRDYNPNAFSNNHNYTANWDEHLSLIIAGWHDEGIGWYGV